MMSDSLEDGPLLLQLAELSPEEGANQLVGAGEPMETMFRLAESVERLTLTNLGEALRIGDALVEIADTLGSAEIRSRMRRAYAHALAYGNRYTEASAILEECLELARLTGDQTAEAHAKMAKVHVLNRLGRWPESIIAAKEAHDLFKENGEAMLAAKTEANLGVTYRMSGQPEQALACFESAHRVLGENPVVGAQLDSNRGEALLDLNRFPEAESAFREAVQVFEEHDQDVARFIAEGNLADLMSRQGRLREALFHFEQARRHGESSSIPGDLARLEAEHAEALAMCGLMSDAVEAFRESLVKLDEHGLKAEAARARVHLARLLLHTGRFDEAHTVIDEATTCFLELGQKIGVGRALVVRGRLAFERGEFETAESTLEEARSLLQDSAADAAMAQYQYAVILSELGREREAIAAVTEALTRIRKLNLAPLLADLLHVRGRIRFRTEREDALVDLREAVANVERIRGSLQADRFRAAFAGDRNELYEDLLWMLLDDGSESSRVEGFTVGEQGKGRSLLDLVAGVVDLTLSSGPRSATGPHARLLVRIGQLLREINVLYSRLDQDDLHDASESRSWRSEIAEREQELRRHEHRLAAGRGAAELIAPAIDLRTTKALLDEDTTVIEYFVTRGDVVAYALNNRDHAVVRLGPMSAIVDDLDQLQFEIARVMSYRDGADAGLVDAARAVLERLHRFLVAPVVQTLEANYHLHIVPTGLLHHVPFHALYDGEKHLVEAHAFTYSPSASLLRHIRDKDRLVRAQLTHRRAVMFGVPDAVAPFVREEITRVRRSIRSAEVFIGEQATLEQLRRTVPGAKLVHLATHGRFIANSPLASGLRFTDGWLTVRDIYELALDDAIVVLTGCDTGRSRVAGADELVGLMRGFFTAGASGLVLSLWSLHDETAMNLIAELYKAWENGDGASSIGLAAAMRRAQLDMLRQMPHPAYWAPFVLVGRP